MILTETYARVVGIIIDACGVFIKPMKYECDDAMGRCRNLTLSLETVIALLARMVKCVELVQRCMS